MPEARRGAARQSLHSVLYSLPAWSPEQSNLNPIHAGVPPEPRIHPRFAQAPAPPGGPAVAWTGESAAQKAGRGLAAPAMLGTQAIWQARASVCGLPAGLRLRQLHRQQPSDPEEDEVEKQKDQQARLRPNALDEQSDEIVGNVAERHETHIVKISCTMPSPR